MLRPSTAPRWKMAIKVLRRPPVMRSRPCANTVRCKNDGAAVASPMLANATLLDFKKNLRFIVTPLKLKLSAFSRQLSAKDPKLSAEHFRSLSLKLGRAEYECGDARDLRIDGRRIVGCQLTERCAELRHEPARALVLSARIQQR